MSTRRSLASLSVAAAVPLIAVTAPAASALDPTYYIYSSIIDQNLNTLCLNNPGIQGSYSDVDTCTQVFGMRNVGTSGGHNVVEIVNEQNGHCQVDDKLAGHGVEDGTCGSLPNGWEYRWTVLPATGGTWSFQLLGTNLCLDVNSSEIAIVNICNASSVTQRWHI